MPNQSSIPLIHVATVLMVAASALQAQGPNRVAVGYYSKGLQLLKNRDFRNAAIEFEQAVEADSSYGDAHYALGKTYKTLSQFERAIRAFETAHTVGVSSERARSQMPAQLADVYTKAAVQSFKKKKFREAITNFEKTLYHNPKNAQVLYHLGLCYTALRRQPSAIQAFKNAIRVDPTYVRAHKALGDGHRRQGELRLALKTYRQAITLDATHMPAYSGLAKIQIAGEDFEGAQTTLRKAVEVDPDFAEGFLLLGHTLNQISRYHEAIEPIRRSIEIDRDNAAAHYRLAEAYYGVGDWRKALDAGRDAARKRRDYHPAQVVIADAYKKLGQAAEARTWYNKAKEDHRFRDWCLHQLKELERQP